MKLYHGSNVIVKHPEILVPKRTLDYGSGFYTTTSQDQARQWVLRKIKGIDTVGYVNIYEVDIDAIKSELKLLKFETADEPWLDFVMNNRTNRNYQHDYDVIYGPVANDRVYAAFALFESGVFNKADLIRELRTYKLVDQLLFHTKESLSFLHFIEAQKIEI